MCIRIFKCTNKRRFCAQKTWFVKSTKIHVSFFLRTYMNKHKEIRFEEAIETHLLSNGYLKGNPQEFSNEFALFPNDVISFIKQSQPKYWDKIEEFHGERSFDVLVQALARKWIQKVLCLFSATASNSSV